MSLSFIHYLGLLHPPRSRCVRRESNCLCCRSLRSEPHRVRFAWRLQRCAVLADSQSSCRCASRALRMYLRHSLILAVAQRDLDGEIVQTANVSRAHAASQRPGNNASPFRAPSLLHVLGLPGTDGRLAGPIRGALSIHLSRSESGRLPQPFSTRRFPIRLHIGVEQAVVSPAAISITAGRAGCSYRDRTDHTG